MAGYRRFIAYVYEYPQGKKGNGKGFIKVEAKDGMCRMQYKLNGLYGRESIPGRIYGYVRRNGECRGVPLGTCDMAGTSIQFEHEMEEENMGGSGYALEDLCGLVLMADSGEIYGSGWDDQSVEPEKIRFPEDSLKELRTEEVEIEPEECCEISEETIALEECGEIPEEKIEAEECCKIPEEKTEPEECCEMREDRIDPEEHREMREDRRDWKERREMWEDRGNREDRREMREDRRNQEDGGEMREDRIDREDRREMREDRIDREDRGEMWEDRRDWEERLRMPELRRESQEKETTKTVQGKTVQAPRQRIRREPMEQCLFSDNSIVDCRKITPADWRMLGRRDRGLMNNKFLHHGYSNYGHLILGRREEDGRYILGIPGVYECQESLMAGMFGFPYFKETGGRPINNRFGYWYRLIDTPDFGQEKDF